MATRRHELGFTLAEMLFVVVIVGIMTAMMTPLFSPGRWRADSAVQELAMTMNASQRLAVMRQHDVVLRFLLDERRVRIHQDTDNDGVEDTGEDVRVMELPETMGFGAGSVPQLPQGAGPVSFKAKNGMPTLVFHRNGSTNSTGAVYLRPLEGSLSNSPYAVRAVTVERATAEVRCYSFRTGSWADRC
jgi:prepilin-type N-terminal cleavage/methylation domain-containing protein